MVLPVETWNQIIHDPIIGKKDISNLCITSRYLSAVAYTALYSHVVLDTRQKIELAIGTFIESPRLTSLVHWITLKLGTGAIVIDPEDKEWIRIHRANLTTAINSMNQLRRLSINRVFMTTLSPDSDRIAPWTCEFDLPNLERLDLSYPANVPWSKLFARLPDPIPVFTTSAYPFHSHIDGVTQLQCYDINPPTVPLPWLKRLFLSSAFGVYRFDFAPNLEALAILDNNSKRDIDLILKSTTSRKIKKLATIYCFSFSVDFLDRISQFRRLEMVVIDLSSGFSGEFDINEIHALGQALPSLDTICLLCPRRIYDKAEIWKRKPSEGFDDDKSWSMSTEYARDRFDITRKLLEIV